MAYYKEVKLFRHGGMNIDMKKKIMVFFLTGLLGMSMLLGGCTSKSEKKAQEYKELGIKQMQEENYKDAVNSFQKALDQSLGRIRAQELDVCYYKALAQYKSGDTKAAIETYDNLIDYDGKNWEVYYLRGSVLLADGQNEAALKDYAQAVSLNESDAKLYGHISENLQNAGEKDQAQSYLEKGLQIKPSSAADYEGLGELYALKGDTENAASMYNQAAEKGEDSAYLSLGKMYAANDQMDEAKAAFQKYMDKYPKDADALEQLGEIAAESGDYADAATYYKKSIENAADAQRKGLQKELVAMYEKSGDFSSALETAKAYVADYPDDADMQKEYEFLQTRVDAGGDVIEGNIDDTTTEGNEQ